MTTGRLAALACANGLGHVKRQVVVLDRLREAVPERTLLCAGWQVDVLRDWPPFARLPAVEVVETPIVWRDEPDAYGEWLLGWHDRIAGWDLDRFDLVWSDNLVEPLAHAGERVVLGGSFLWPDVLAAAFPEILAVARYRSWCNDLLDAYRPPMTASRRFAMPAVAERTALEAVGLTPLVERAARPGARTYLTFAGSSPEAGRARAGAADVAHRLAALGFQPVQDLDDAGVIVARAGLGTISDAAARRLPLVLLEDRNPEIAHNRSVAIALGIAVGADDIDRLGDVVELGDEELRGADEIASVLAGRLGV